MLGSETDRNIGDPQKYALYAKSYRELLPGSEPMAFLSRQERRRFFLNHCSQKLQDSAYFSVHILRPEFKRGGNIRIGPQIIRRSSREHAQGWLLGEWACLIMREEKRPLQEQGRRKGSTFNLGNRPKPLTSVTWSGSRPIHLC